METNPASGRFITIERTILSQEIAQRILELIREGQVKPNEKLPPERELASMLGVSRPSLREALRALQLMHIIEVRQGDGTYVSSLEPEHLARSCETVLQLLNDVSYIEVLEARRVLEPAIVSLSAIRISDDQIQQLKDCLNRAKEAVNDPGAFLETDFELHALIVEASGNPLLRSLYSSITYLGIATREKTVHIPGIRESTLKHHAGIVEALENRDPDRSYLAMKGHLIDVENALKRVDMES